MKHVTILIPCHNEEHGLKEVLKSIPHRHLKRLGVLVSVTVIDNNSTDNTAIVAAKLGAKVIKESRQGKGIAVRRGIASLSETTDYVVMLDGDNTYKLHELPRMIEPLMSGFLRSRCRIKTFRENA